MAYASAGRAARRSERNVPRGSDLMRVLIATAGSRGDVASFTGLGQRLEQAGHQVAIAAHEVFAELVRGCGLECRLLPGDPVELARAPQAVPSPGGLHRRVPG